MVVDTFTLFPEWFTWFLRQRHVRNALRLGHNMRFFNYRDTTPLGHGQVDDTPYGGGAGMVIRVDVVDAALEAVYGAEGERPPNTRIVVLGARARRRDARAVHLGRDPLGPGGRDSPPRALPRTMTKT